MMEGSEKKKHVDKCVTVNDNDSRFNEDGLKANFNKLHFDNALVSEAEGLIANGLIQQYWERLARPQLTFLASNWTQFPQPYSLQAR
jgi:hypothetical protein